MESRPLVSVVIPVYNGSRYLAEAIESVLAQSYAHVELTVVDDGSTDESATIARQFGPAVCCTAQPHRGAGAARNHGVALAHGSLLAFLDADDLWVPDKLTRQLAAFDADPTLDAVFGYVEHFYSPELGEHERQQTLCPVGLAPCYIAGAMLVTREAFERVGSFATRWQLGEVVDWYLRAREAGLATHLLPELVLRRRLHATNQGIRQRGASLDYVRIVHAALERRRAASPVASDG